jgi:hypothetical protein
MAERRTITLKAVPFSYLTVLLLATVASANTIQTLRGVLDVAGVRSTGARSGEVSAKVARFADDSGDLEQYASTIRLLVQEFEETRPSDVLCEDFFSTIPSNWKLTSRYNLNMLYRGDLFLKTREYVAMGERPLFMPSPSSPEQFVVMPEDIFDNAVDLRPIAEAYDGNRFSVVQRRTLFVESGAEAPMESQIEDFDPSLIKWGEIPEENLARTDQEVSAIRLDDNRVNYFIRNKETGVEVDQVFNVSTGMIERMTSTNSAGHKNEEFLWLGPVRSEQGVWLPRAFIHMKRRGAVNMYEVRFYDDWVMRHVATDEFRISERFYDNVEDKIVDYSSSYDLDRLIAGISKQIGAESTAEDNVGEGANGSSAAGVRAESAEPDPDGTGVGHGPYSAKLAWFAAAGLLCFGALALLLRKL